MKKTSTSNLLQKMQEQNLSQRKGLNSKEKRYNLNRISRHHRTKLLVPRNGRRKLNFKYRIEKMKNL